MLTNKYLLKQPGGQLTKETKKMINNMQISDSENNLLLIRDNLNKCSRYVPKRDLLIKDFTFNEIVVRSYMQNNLKYKTSPAIIYLHGGGFMGGTINSLDATCRMFADYSPVKVYSLQYHLAPENPFPAALIDSYTFLMSLFKHADVFNIDKNKIFISGDSAGGNLSIVTALLDSSAYLNTNFISKVVAFYPPVSCATEGKKEFWNPELFKTNSKETQKLVAKYICGFLKHSKNYDKWYAGNNYKNPLVSPIYASDEQLAKMPSTKIIIGEFDGLRILTQQFGERLLQNNSKASFSVYNGLVHAFLHSPQVFPECNLVIKDAIKFLGIN